MIIDTIENAHLYRPLPRARAAGFGFLASNDLMALPPGRVEIAGQWAAPMYATVAEYDTQPAAERKWEAHRRYIDIQLILRGVERMGFTTPDRVRVTEAYQDATDVAFYAGEGEQLLAPAGTFVIFWPHDVHMPNLNPAEGRVSKVRKIVVKVPVVGG